MRNCQLKSGSKDKGTSAGKVFAESLAAVEHAAVVRDYGAVSPLTMEFLRARVRRKWQVSGPDPLRTVVEPHRQAGRAGRHPKFCVVGYGSTIDRAKEAKIQQLDKFVICCPVAGHAASNQQPRRSRNSCPRTTIHSKFSPQPGGMDQTGWEDHAGP